MDAKLLANLALAAAFAVGASTLSAQAQAQSKGFVKCYVVSIGSMDSLTLSYLK